MKKKMLKTRLFQKKNDYFYNRLSVSGVILPSLIEANGNLHPKNHFFLLGNSMSLYIFL
jgi:hypothetical protein